jgi:transcriptional regulator with XRE-family HTH domain
MGVSSLADYVFKELEPVTPKEVYYEKDLWAIASNVQIIREKYNLTQKQLSERMGYKSTSFISNLELWNTEKIPHERVEKLAQCLGVDLNELLRRDELVITPDSDEQFPQTNKIQNNKQLRSFVYLLLCIFILTLLIKLF